MSSKKKGTKLGDFIDNSKEEKERQKAKEETRSSFHDNDRVSALFSDAREIALNNKRIASGTMEGESTYKHLNDIGSAYKVEKSRREELFDNARQIADSGAYKQIKEERDFMRSLSYDDRKAYERLKKSGGAYVSPYLQKGIEGKEKLEYDDAAWNALPEEERKKWLEIAYNRTDGVYAKSDRWKHEYATKILQDQYDAKEDAKEMSFIDRYKNLMANTILGRKTIPSGTIENEVYDKDSQAFDADRERAWEFYTLPQDVQEYLTYGRVLNGGDEKAVEQFISEHYDEENLKRLKSYGETIKSIKQQELENARTENWLNRNPLNATILGEAVRLGGDIVGGGIAGIQSKWNYLVNGETDTNKTFFQKWQNKSNYIGRSISDTLQEGGMDGWATVYEQSHSMAENAARAYLSQFVGQSVGKLANLLGAGENAVAATSAITSNVLINRITANSVFNNMFTQSIQQGMAPGEAFNRSLAYAFFEGAFETISFDKMGYFKEKPVLGSWKDVARQLFKGAFVEGMEEYGTEIAQGLYDYYQAYDYSDYKAYKDQLEQQYGRELTDREAWAEYGLVFANKASKAFLGGALSGMVLGASEGGAAYARGNDYRTLGQQISDEEYSRLNGVAEDWAKLFPRVADELNQATEAGEDVRRGYVKELSDAMTERYESRIEKASGQKQLMSVMENMNEGLNGVIPESTMNKFNARLAEMGLSNMMVDYEKFHENVEKGRHSTFSDMAYGEGNSAVLNALAKSRQETFNVLSDRTTSYEEKTTKLDKIFADQERNKERAADIVARLATQNKEFMSPEVQKYIGEEAGYLTAEEAAKAYSQGKFAVEIEKSPATVKPARVSQMSEARAIQVFGDKAKYIDTATYSNTDNFKRAMWIANVAVKMGVNAEIYASTQNVEVPNGAYRDNTVFIDANAGADAQFGAIGEVFSHELTHWMADKNAAMFKDFTKLVRDEMGHGVFDGLVRANILSMKDENGNAIYENADDATEEDKAAATEEVIAQACQRMLKDSQVFAKYAAQDAKTAGKIVAKLREFIKKLTDFLFKSSLNDDATNALEKNIEDLQKIVDAWDAMLQATIDSREMSQEAAKGIVENNPSVAEEIVGTDVVTKESYKASQRLNGELMDKAKKEFAKVGRDLGINYQDFYRAVALCNTVANRMLNPKDLAPYLPEDNPGKVEVGNASYGRSMENAMECIRSIVNNDFTDMVSEAVGRPLTVEEQLVASQILQMVNSRPECNYCYVATDRRAYRASFGTYFNQYETVYNKVAENREAFSKDLNGAEKRMEEVKVDGGEKNRGKGVVAKAYAEFLDGRKNTPDMRKRFLGWVNSAVKGEMPISRKDLTSARVRDNAREDSAKKWFINDAEKYAQSATWAKKVSRVIKVNGKNYVARYVSYNGSILKWKQSLVDALNEEFGLRMYSFSDYVPAFILENMQMIIDASLRGLKVLAYTKDCGFAEAFADTGAGINVSLFGTLDKKANSDETLKALREAYKANKTDATRKAYLSALDKYVVRDGIGGKDGMMGANWDRASELRKTYKNVGTVFVATNDDLVEWALANPEIDVVIPYHLVRTGEEVAAFFDYQNYKSQQEDKKTKAWTSENLKSIPPTIHGNDLETYKQALKDNNLEPRFADFIDNPNYMKLVNETRLSYKEMSPVQPIFDQSIIEREVNRIKDEGQYGLMPGFKTKAEQDAFIENQNLVGQAVDAIGEWNESGKKPIEGLKYSPRNSKKNTTREDVLSLTNVDWDTTNKLTIREQLVKHHDEIARLIPVADVYYYGSNNMKVIDYIIKHLDDIGGGTINREDNVSFTLEESGITYMVSHSGNTPEVRAAALAAPYVLKKGVRISGHKKHKNRKGTDETTLTYAAPVYINDDLVHVGIVVKFDSDGRVKSANVVAEDGGSYRIKNAPNGNYGAQKKIQTSYPSTKGANNSVAQSGADVNTVSKDGIASYTEERVDRLLRQYGSKSSPKYAQAYATYISPDEFLALTTNNLKDIENQSRELDEDELRDNTQEIFLKVENRDGKMVVYGHEGRHRMVALRNAGIYQVAISVIDLDTKYTKEITDSMTLSHEIFNEKNEEAFESDTEQKATVFDLVPISYENEELLKELYTDKKNQIRFSRRNSEGNTLSEAQQEYFKDSKIRDAEGNLKTMFHGTEADFNIFDFSQGGKNGTAEGFGIYLTDNEEVAKAYGGRIIKSYVNVTKPAMFNKKTITSAQLVKLIETTAKNQAQQMIDEEGYGTLEDALKDTWISNYTYTYDKSLAASYREVANSIIRMSDNDRDIIQEVMTGMAIRDYDKAVEFYDVLQDVLGFDGFVTEWKNKNTGEKSEIVLAFNSNQVKNVDNENPTDSPDLRYSLRDLANDESQIIINAMSNSSAIADDAVAVKSIQRYAEEYNKLKAMEEEVSKISKDLRKKGVTPSEKEVGLKRITRLQRAIINKTEELTEMRNQRVLRDILKEEWERRDELVQAGMADAIRMTKEALREKYGDEIAALKEKSKAQKQAIRDRAEINKHKKHIIKTANELMNAILHPNEKHKVPTILINPVRDMLEAIDYWTPKEGRPVSKKSESLFRKFYAFNEAVKAMQSQIDQGADIIEDLFDPDFLEMVDEMTKYVESAEIANVNDMNAEQIKNLDNLLTEIAQVVKIGNNMLAQSRYETIRETADVAKETLDQRKDLREYKSNRSGNIFQRWMAGTLDGYGLARLAGDGTSDIIDELSKAYFRKILLIKEAYEFTDSVLAPYRKDLDRWAEEEYEFNLDSGKTIKMNVRTMVDLYLLSKREQAYKHIVSDTESEMLEKQGEDSEEPSRRGGGIHVKDRKGRFTEIKKISKNDLTNIINTLREVAPGAIEVGEKLQEFGATTVTAWGNRASNLLYGINKFTEPDYWAIRSSESAMKQENTDQKKMLDPNRLKNMGRAKAITPGANNAIYVEDFLDVWTDTIDDMTSYAEMLPAVTDANRWWNSRVEEGSNKRIKDLFAQKLGTDMANNFRDLITALNGGVKGQDTLSNFAKKLMGKSKAAAVALNPRVVFQQFTAYPRALAVIEPKYLEKALTMKPSMKEAQDHSAIAWLKHQGFYSNGLAPSVKKLITGDATAAEKITEKTMVFAGMADDITWGYLWNAARLKVEDTTNLTRGTQEYWDAIDEIMSDIVNNTQVVDTPFTKSPWMRSKGLASTYMAFMAEPMKTTGMVMTAIDNFLQDHKNGKKILAITATAWLLQSAANAAAQAIADAARDDDREKDYWEKYVAKYLGNLKDNLNPLTYIPVIKDVWSSIKGFTNKNLVMQGTDNLIAAVKELIKVANGESKYTLFGSLEIFAKAASYLTGVPVSNGMRIFNSFGNVFEIDWLRRKDFTASELGRNVVLEIRDGNLDKADEYYEKLLKACKGDEKKAKLQIETYLSKHDDDVDRMANDFYEDATTLDDSIAELVLKYASKYIDDEVANKAIRKAAQIDLKEEDSEEKISTTSAAETIYNSSDINRALEKGKLQEAQQIIDAINAGYKAKDSKDTAKDLVATYWKPKYLEAIGAERDKIAKMLYKLRNNGKQMFSASDLQKWVKDAQKKQKK